MSKESIPHVVIIGRTNVGKSTLFNKLIEEQKSLVSDIPGTTRDRHESDCLWRGRMIRLVDTGGLDKPQNSIDEQIHIQAEAAIKQADLILLIVDLQAGKQQEDIALAKKVRDQNIPIIVVGNKADNKKIRERINDADWHKWELSTPRPISSKNGTGTGDLLDEVFEKLENHGNPPAEISDISTMRVSVIGRPNVGKSSLLNSILGEHRFIAMDEEHTTRGPNDSMLHIDGRDYLFVDTAGVRKRARRFAGKSKLEITGVEKSLRIAGKSHVVLFVVDISKKIHAQDKHLAGKLAEAGSSVIIIANKWDLIPDKDPVTINKYEEYLRHHLPMLRYAPIIFTSAKTGKRVQGVFDVIDHVFASRFTQLSDEELKKFISQAIIRHKPSRGKGVAHPRIMSFKQRKVNPPTFALNIRHTRKDVLAKSYLKFLENQLRDQYDFEGTPIRIHVKGKKKSHTT